MRNDKVNNYDKLLFLIGLLKDAAYDYGYAMATQNDGVQVDIKSHEEEMRLAMKIITLELGSEWVEDEANIDGKN